MTYFCWIITILLQAFALLWLFLEHAIPIDPDDSIRTVIGATALCVIPYCIARAVQAMSDNIRRDRTDSTPAPR